jgi:hypothetical protein
LRRRNFQQSALLQRRQFPDVGDQEKALERRRARVPRRAASRRL